jgi:acyl-CoA thioester hydrolase
MHETRCRVRYAETDQMGVVYYANYYVWMEIGRVELVRSLGISYQDMEQSDGLLLSVVESQCRYIAPARYDQEVSICTEIVNSNARLIEFRYEIKDAESRQPLARGATKHLWLNRDFRPTKLPGRYLARIQQVTSAKVDI